jgi:hypothetical protein
LVQTSELVQTLWSLHIVPSATAGFEHAPVVELHMPAVWHWSLAVQTTRSEPTQLPAEQVSTCVQALPSLHPAPSFWLL